MNPGSFCGTCGAVTTAGALYCGSCGTPAVPAASAPSPPAAPPTMTGTIGSSPPATEAPGPDPAARPVGFASFARRLTAFLVDAALGAATAIAPYLLLLAGARDGDLWTVLVAFGLSMVVPLAYIGLLWAMAAYGNSPGNALLGIRVVREGTGSRPGAGVGLGRLLLRGLLIGITLGVGGFSPLWDSTGRRRGWWDRACGTVVLARGAVPAYADAAVAARLPTLAAMSLGGLPEPVPAGAPVPGDGTEPTGFERPSWDIMPVRPAGAAPVRTAPAAAWADRPADPPPPGPAAVRRSAPSVPPPVPPPSVTPPVSPSGGPIDPHWAAAPPAPGVIAAVPGFGTPAGPSLDHTRMRVSAEPVAPAGPGWSAVLDDGAVLTLAGSVLLGRDPAAGAGDPAAVTVPIVDEARSVSKTHLLLDVGPAGVSVTDRHSTNGVVVLTAGVELPCVPGVPTPVPDGSTVRFGDRSLIVRRT